MNIKKILGIKTIETGNSVKTCFCGMTIFKTKLVDDNIKIYFLGIQILVIKIKAQIYNQEELLKLNFVEVDNKILCRK